jgi:general secretion pathway protein C
MVFWKKWNISFLKDFEDWKEQPPVAWLVLFLGVVLLAAVMQWWWRFQIPSVPADLVSPRPVETPQVLPLDKLMGLHLFGQNIEQNLGNLPETTLQLTLKGIYSDPDEAWGSAIIAVPGKEDHVYLIGDTIPGGAVLLDIYEDRVILRRAGQLEVLKLPQKKLEIKGS